jgi:glutamate N-acetyltransferase / amino-acid N-acetyltransferase
MKKITDIDGIYASGINCGIKPDKNDLAYIYIPDAYATAGMFTKNKFAAHCVGFTKKKIEKNPLKVMIINSGNANAATGKQGAINNKAIALLASQILKIEKSEVGVASTGVIGEQLPIKKIEQGLNTLLADVTKKDAENMSKAILTTDTFQKAVFKEAVINGKKIEIAGVAKGAGMIAPNMATMLVFLVTNARINSDQLKKCLTKAVDDSFNAISIDTDTSTNDMVLCFSTGDKNAEMHTKEEKQEFYKLLLEASQELAKMIVKDGEGATKFVEVVVKGAANWKDARVLAKSVVDSPLVKTAVHGADPNWGRIVMAIGKCENVKINPDKLKLKIGDYDIFANSVRLDFCREEVHKYMEGKKITITIDLCLGSATSFAWGCDLTKEYVELNIEYS